MTNYKATIILAFGGFAIAGAYILDHYCNGGRSLDFLKEKLIGFKRWVAGDERKKKIEMNEGGVSNEAYPSCAIIQAKQYDVG